MERVGSNPSIEALIEAHERQTPEQLFADDDETPRPSTFVPNSQPDIPPPAVAAASASSSRDK